MNLLTTLVSTLLALSLIAGSNGHSASDKGRDSKPDPKAHGNKLSGKQDKNRGHDKEEHHANDCDDAQHNHPKPPEPPTPPKDCTKVPAAPTQLTAEAVSLFQINLTWTDNSTNELGFKIERSLDGKNYSQIAQVLPNTTAYRDLNRFPGTKYFYRTRAFNGKGDSAYSAVARTQTPAPNCSLALFDFGSVLSSGELHDLVAVAAGGNLSTALQHDGTVVSWQHYIGRTNLDLTNVVAIASGQDHGLALRANGTVLGWGQNAAGQIDIPSGLSNVVAIAAGSYHNLALRADGTVVTWGYANYDELAVPAGLAGVVAIAAGNAHSLALRSDGTVVSWGMRLSQPQQNLDEFTDIVAIAAGDFLGIALHADGHVSTWAYDDRTAVPPPADLTNAISIAVGSIWNVAIREDRSMASWGYQTLFGFPPTNLTGVAAVSVFGLNTLALTETPTTPARLTTSILATNRVGLSWLRPSLAPGSILIQRATNVTVTYPLGRPLVDGDWADLATVPGTVTGYDDHSTFTNQTYWYRLIAQNGCGVSLSSSVVEASIRPPIYQPSLSGQAFADNVVLNYSTANLGFTGITIERSSDPDGLLEPWQVITTMSSTNLLLPYTNSGLALNSTYWYRAKERNGLGASPYSLPVAVTITVPAPPVSLMAQIGTTNKVILSWYAGGVGDQAGFKIERGVDLDGFPIGWTEVGTVTNSAMTSYTDTVAGARGMTCWYRLRSFNSLGDSEYCQPISIHLLSPDAPTLFGQNYGTTATLSWQLAYSATDTRFELERTRGENGTPEAWQQIATGTNVPNGGWLGGSYTDPGLIAGETYRYRVRLSNWLGGSDYSSPVSLTILPPAAPSLSSIGVGGSNYVTLSWWMNNIGLPSEVHIERALDNNLTPGAWTEIAKITSGKHGWDYPAFLNDSNVVAGATYWYRLRAADAAGMSDYSTPLRFIVEPPPQASPVYVYNFADSARLQWYYPASLYHAAGFKIQRAPDLNGAPGEWALVGTLTASPAYNPDYNNYFTNTALTAGTHWYRVAPFNWAGDSAYSQAAAVTIQAPSAGSSLTAQVGNTQQVVLRWFAPLSNDQDGVEVEHAPDVGGAPGNWDLLARIYRTNQPYLPNYYPAYPFFEVTNVLANTTNWYRLRGFNAVGYSTYLGPAEARTVLPPPVPVNLEAQNQGTHVGLSWSSSFDYGYVSEFELQRAPDESGTPGDWTQLALVPGGDSNYFFYNDDALSASAKYWYRVRSRNWLGQSDFSLPVSISVPPLPLPNISALRIGQQNQVQFDLRVDYYTYGQRGYRIERAPDNSGVPGTWSEIGSVFSNFSGSVRFTDTNVSAFSTNWYRARTIGVVGLSEPGPMQRLSVIPPPPPYFSASAVAQRVTLSWDAWGYNDYGNVTGFQIERAPDANGAPGSWARIGFATIGTGNFSGTYNDTTLAPTNGTYRYRLQAYNWIGVGDYATNRISIQPPNPPNSVTATISSTNRVKVTWYSQYPADQDGFKVDRSLDVNGQPGSWVELAAFRDTGTYFHGFVDTNVNSGATYWYRVRSFTVIGDSLPSNLASVSLVPPPTASLLAFTFANRVNLSWSADYYQYGLVEEFELERAADNNNAPGTWAKLTSLAGNVQSYVDAGLPPEARRWYRVRAHNWLGYSAYSDPVSAAIVPPAGPIWVTALIRNTNQVQLTLQAYSPYEQDGFEIERAAETNDTPGVWETLGRVAAANQYRAAFTDSNALAFTTNWYRARTFNAAGTSTNSEPLRIALVPPPVPEYFTANAFANQAQLAWNAYYPDYGQIQGFKIERAGDVNGSPDTWTQITNLAAPNFPDWFPPWPFQLRYRSFVDLDLVAHAAYWYRIRAYNWIGDGEPTYPVRVEILPPAPPRSLTAKIGGTNSVELEWNPSSRSDQQGYLIERASDANGVPAAWEQIATVTNYVGFILPWIHYPRYSDPNVSANTKLWYRVRAYNVVGLSDYSAPAQISLTPPPSPSIYYYSAVADRVDLGWQGPSDYTYGAVTGYRLERAATTGNGPGAWTEIISTPNASHQDSDLAAGQYWYRVKAYNWIGAGSFSSPISVTVVPPNPPRYLQAMIGTTNQVSVNWQSATTQDQDGFQLELAADVGGLPGSWELLATIPATNSYAASFMQTNAAAYTTNWYRVRAFNRVGFSAFGEPLKFIVAPPSAPEYLSASAYADRADLQWSSYHYYNYGTINGFLLERAIDVNGNPGAWTQITQVPHTSYNYIYYSDPNLQTETTYWYRVRAYSWVGVSTNSPTVSVTIRKPAAPIFVTSLIGLTNHVNVSWSTSYPYDANVFFVERAADAGGVPGGWTQLGAQTNGYYYNHFTDTNVMAFTTNWYRVRALNAAGYSDYSAPIISRVVPPPAVNTIQQSRLANQVTFAFVSYLDAYGYLAGYKIERAADNNGGPGTWAQIVAAPTLDYYGSYTDSNLLAGATYWYRLRAWNWVGEGAYTSPVSITILPPGTPTSIYASASYPTEIGVWWYASYPPDQDGFKIERSIDAQNTWTDIALVPATNFYYASYSDTNFAPNVTNYYRVRAFNVVGYSSYSPTASVIVKLPSAVSDVASPSLPPPRITQLTLTNHDIIVTWTALGGTTNVVEATVQSAGSFVPISPHLRLEGSGNVTANYLDVGALTNSASRFYRIRLVP